MNNFQEELIEVVSPYYINNDAAHRLDHAKAVVVDSIKLIDYLGREDLLYPAVAASYLHDMFAPSRVAHEQLIYDDLLYGKLSVWFDDFCCRYIMDKVVIATACLEHRSSYKGEFSHQLSEIISSADRGAPNVKDTLSRLIQYYHSYHEHNVVDNILNAVNHVIDKYGRDSNKKYPDLWKKYHKNDLDMFYSLLDTKPVVIGMGIDIYKSLYEAKEDLCATEKRILYELQ